MSLFPDEMFPDRADVYAPAPGGSKDRDPSGGRPPDPTTPSKSAMPCAASPLSEQEVAALSALGMQAETKVYFRDDPGPLASGSKVALTKFAAARPAFLVLKRLAQESLAEVAVWRADCQGRA